MKPPSQKWRTLRSHRRALNLCGGASDRYIAHFMDPCLRVMKTSRRDADKRSPRLFGQDKESTMGPNSLRDPPTDRQTGSLNDSHLSDTEYYRQRYTPPQTDRGYQCWSSRGAAFELKAKAGTRTVRKDLTTTFGKFIVQPRPGTNWNGRLCRIL
jgi:hypothetical protein